MQESSMFNKDIVSVVASFLNLKEKAKLAQANRLLKILMQSILQAEWMKELEVWKQKIIMYFPHEVPHIEEEREDSLKPFSINVYQKKFKECEKGIFYTWIENKKIILTKKKEYFKQLFNSAKNKNLIPLLPQDSEKAWNILSNVYDYSHKNLLSWLIYLEDQESLDAISRKKPRKFTDLAWDVACNQKEKVEKLLASHPDRVNQYSTSSGSLLYIAALFGNLGMLELLVRRNANLSLGFECQHCNFSCSPLDIAIKNGHLPVVKYLIEQMDKNGTINSNERYKKGIHIAIKSGHLSIVKFFIEEKKISCAYFDSDYKEIDAYLRRHEKMQEFEKVLTTDGKEKPTTEKIIKLLKWYKNQTYLFSGHCFHTKNKEIAQKLIKDIKTNKNLTLEEFTDLEKKYINDKYQPNKRGHFWALLNYSETLFANKEKKSDLELNFQPSPSPEVAGNLHC